MVKKKNKWLNIHLIYLLHSIFNFDRYIGNFLQAKAIHFDITVLKYNI